jgi:hypothetical protein
MQWLFLGVMLAPIQSGNAKEINLDWCLKHYKDYA